MNNIFNAKSYFPPKQIAGDRARAQQRTPADVYERREDHAATELGPVRGWRPRQDRLQHVPEVKFYLIIILGQFLTYYLSVCALIIF